MGYRSEALKPLSWEYRQLKGGYIMSFGLPQNLAPRLVHKSFTRAAHVAAFVLLGATAVMLCSFQVWRPSVTLWVAVLPLALMAVVLILLDRRRTVRWALLYLAVGAPTVFFVTWSVASQLDVLRVTDLLGYPYVKSAVILVGGTGLGRSRMLMWGTAGYIVAEASAAAALAVAGAPWSFDPVTGLAFFGLCLLIVLSGLTGVSGRRVESRLRRAAQDEVAAAVLFRIEQRASAILHDTVLNHLSTLSHTPNGRLPDDHRKDLQHDLDLVRGTTLGETFDIVVPSAADAAGWNAHPIHDAIRAARARGLDVDVTGDPEVVLALCADTARIVGLAVDQCLVNVSKHAGVTEAEVAIHSSGDEVMLMVIYDGRGFDLQAVGADRLGLRSAIRGRLESIGGSVRVWTSAGKGTSIVMQVPVSGPSGSGSGDTGRDTSLRRIAEQSS